MKIRDIIKLLIPTIIALLAVVGINVAITQNEEGEWKIDVTATIELASEQMPTLIETSEGVVEISTPTVENVDDNRSTEDCGKDEECGRGWYVDTSTPEAFENATYGQCIDTDGHYGSQCWDLGNLFWQNYAGRSLSTCGTGAAKGILNCVDYNAGDEFVMIWNPEELQAGDWIVFTNGTYGHVGMALGGYNNGYVALYGTNQGGASCPGGGAASNVINISLKSFGGAFRPKSYIKPEPEPEPIIPITGCILWHVERGDTMSKIMLDCENTVVYGDAMDNYAKTWYSLIYKPNQSVYDGWQSETGVGLYAGDDIEHRTK